jgi:hypothetical protein
MVFRCQLNCVTIAFVVVLLSEAMLLTAVTATPNRLDHLLLHTQRSSISWSQQQYLSLTDRTSTQPTTLIFSLTTMRGGAGTSTTPPRWGLRVAPSISDRFQASSKTTTSTTPTAQQSEAQMSADAKDLMNAFLTRDSRNHFIGRSYLC